MFEKELWTNRQEQLRDDVIIRDMKRMNAYPEPSGEKVKGISPWFRAGLMDTYDRGILIGLRWGTLTKHGADWRYTNHEAGERGDITVILIGSIRYEDIAEVDWVGDQYYGYPHIYCFFSHKGEPYERTAFYTEHPARSGRRRFFTEVAPYDEVRRRSRKLGIKYFS